MLAHPDLLSVDEKAWLSSGLNIFIADFCIPSTYSLSPPIPDTASSRISPHQRTLSILHANAESDFSSPSQGPENMPGTRL
jgi:hypothetical protein